MKKTFLKNTLLIASGVMLATGFGILAAGASTSIEANITNLVQYLKEFIVTTDGTPSGGEFLHVSGSGIVVDSNIIPQESSSDLLALNASGQVVKTAVSAGSSSANPAGVVLIGTATIDLNVPFGYILELTNFSGTFEIGDNIGDENSNSATISTVSGNTITVNNASSMVWSGIITDNTIGSTADLVSSTVINPGQEIPLTGGTKYAVTDVFITNASSQPAYSMMGNGFEITNALERSGVVIAQLSSNDLLNKLSSTDFFLSKSSNTILLYPDDMMMSVDHGTLVSSLYASVTSANGEPCTVDVYVYGYIIN